MDIVLSSGHTTVIDDADFPIIDGYGWYLSVGKGVNKLYVQARSKSDYRVKVLMHRLILGVSGNVQVDHRDGNGLNNRRDNLRECTQSQNLANQIRHDKDKTTSPYKGVDRNRNMWRARIGINGKRINLGQFDSEIMAASMYNKAALEVFGEFARINEFI